MESVKTFNSELSSLYEFKPPISKAKMTSITKSAIKAIKFYKHVVQSVEKFIQKCKVEYKIPGLYVIDSIVRQSRHQFGAEKDVFAPRFTRNIKVTFYYIFKCSPQEKSKVVRVLNLWQKNNVFPAETIQPLFDLADPNHSIHQEIENELENHKAAKGNPNKIQVRQDLYPELQQHESCHTWNGQNKDNSGNNEEATKHHSGFNLDPNVLHQLQHLQHVFSHSQGQGEDIKDSVQFNKKLLDFDYGEEEDEDQISNSLSQSTPFNQTIRQLLNNRELLRQLQNIQPNRGADGEIIPGLGDGFGNSYMHDDKRGAISRESSSKCDERQYNDGSGALCEPYDMKSKDSVDGKHGGSNMDFSHSFNHHQYDDRKDSMQPPLPDALFAPGKDYDQRQLPFSWSLDTSRPPPGFRVGTDQPPNMSEKPGDKADHDIQILSCDNDRSVARDKRSPNRNSRYRRRSRSRSRDRKRRSRSRSKSRPRRDRGHSRSKSRERERERMEREKERLEREKDRERRKKGLPAVKKEMLCVCSTTLWVGHLSKLVHEEELSDTFGQYGEIVSIDLIPPRGCAFICMNRRQDAFRALQKLKNHKLQGKAITLAWAPGKGVKGKELKDYWDIELGVSYIPWSKVTDEINLDELEEGSMIDEDSLPEKLKARYKKSGASTASFEPQSQLTAGASKPAGNDMSAVLPQVATGSFPNGVFSEAALKSLGQYPPVPPMLFTAPSVPPCMPLLSNVVGLPPQTALSQLLPLSQTVFPTGQAGAFLGNAVSQAGSVSSLPLPPPPVPQTYDPVAMLEEVAHKASMTPDKVMFKLSKPGDPEANSRERNGYSDPDDRTQPWPSVSADRDELGAVDEDLRLYSRGLLDNPRTHPDEIMRDEDFRDREFLARSKYDDRYRDEFASWPRDRSYHGSDVSPDRDNPYEGLRDPYGEYPDYDRDERMDDYRYGQRGRYPYRGEGYSGHGSPYREPFHDPPYPGEPYDAAFSDRSYGDPYSADPLYPPDPFRREPPFPGDHFRGPRFSMPRPEFHRMLAPHRGHGFPRGHPRGNFGGQFGSRPPRHNYSGSGRGGKGPAMTGNRARNPDGKTEREPRKTRWGEECNRDNSEVLSEPSTEPPKSGASVSDYVVTPPMDESVESEEPEKGIVQTDTEPREPVLESEQPEISQQSEQ